MRWVAFPADARFMQHRQGNVGGDAAGEEAELPAQSHGESLQVGFNRRFAFPAIAPTSGGLRGRCVFRAATARECRG